MYRCTGAVQVRLYRCTGVQVLYRCAVGVAGTLSGYMECKQRFFSQLEAEVEVRRRRRVELVQAAAAGGQGIESLLPI